MGDVGALQERHLHGYSDAVVCSQRGSFGLHPLAIYVGLDSVLHKVELRMRVLFAHHIHVALQDKRFPVLHTCGGRLAYDDVSCLVAY